MSREAKQVEHIERLLQRQRDLTGSAYADAFLTVSVEEVVGAMNDGAAEWDAQQVGVIPKDDAPDWKQIAKNYMEFSRGNTTVRQYLEQAGFDEDFIKAFIAGNAVCPECEAGKHENCDGTALSDDDEMVDCRCAKQGHGE